MRKKSLVAMVACLGALAVVIAPAAPAQDAVCMGAAIPTDPFVGFPVSTLPPGTYDNIIVPPGETCFLSGVTVRGNVKALRDSRLFITASTVDGDIQGDQADNVQVWNDEIGGNVEIKEGGPSPGFFFEAFVCSNEIERGSIQVEKMTSLIGILVQDVDNSACTAAGTNVLQKGDIKVNENTFGALARLTVHTNVIESGNLQVFKNKGGVSKEVVGNVVLQGVIQCYENTMPFVGAPNSGRADPWLPFLGPNQCMGTETT